MGGTVSVACCIWIASNSIKIVAVEAGQRIASYPVRLVAYAWDLLLYNWLSMISGYSAIIVNEQVEEAIHLGFLAISSITPPGA